MISVEARAGGIIDIGVSTSSDFFSMQWNPVKYAFTNKEHSFL